MFDPLDLAPKPARPTRTIPLPMGRFRFRDRMDRVASVLAPVVAVLVTALFVGGTVMFR